MTTTKSELGKFEGDEILNVGIRIRNAGDGLSKAMKIEPKVLHRGDTCLVVLECTVGPITFEPVKDTEGVARVQVLTAGTATFVDDDVVRKAITDQADRNERAKEEEAGVQRLPTSDELSKQHFSGKHAKSLVEGCPDCDDEKAATAAES